jgi:hypothetical protein
MRAVTSPICLLTGQTGFDIDPQFRAENHLKGCPDGYS